MADNMHISYATHAEYSYCIICRANSKNSQTRGKSRATGCISCIFERTQADGKCVLHPFKTNVVHRLCDKDREAGCYRLGVKDIGKPQIVVRSGENWFQVGEYANS